MADTKVTDLTANTAPILTDVMYIIDDPGGSPASQKVTLEDLLQLINVDGWVPAGETWTYASADDPTFTFTIAGVDLTTKYYAGMRLKLTQTSAKYFIVTKIAFSTDTTVTIYGGTDYDLADAAITLPYYSTAKAPAGFPMDRTKWDWIVTDTSERGQATPTQNVWYNLGSITISIPIGSWDVGWQVCLDCDDSSVTNIQMGATLSTANNSESDLGFSVFEMVVGASGSPRFFRTVGRSKPLTLTSKTAYYLNGRTTNTGINNIEFRGDLATTTIWAKCAYL